MSSANQLATDESLIVWDVIEEHFDEAAFLIATFQDALLAPNYTLDEVADRVEERLTANLEGLEMGGKAVAKRLLIPALTESPDDGYASAAALVLLKCGDVGDKRAVLDAVAATDGEQQEGLALGIELATDVDGLDFELKQRFSGTTDEAQCAVWLSILNKRRIHPGSHLKFCLGSTNERLLAEAMRSLGVHYTPSHGRQYAKFIQKHLNSSSVEVQLAAVELGLLIGMPEAWDQCLALARTSAANRAQYLEWVALLSSRGEFQLLFSLLDDEEFQESAMWSLGLTGSMASVEQALTHLDSENPRLAKLAFEAMSYITGIDMEENAFQLDEELDDEEEIITGLDDEPPALDPIEHLVLPNPETIKKWWAENKDRFSPDQRYVMGEKLDVKTLLNGLAHWPMRLRNPLSWALTIRTYGKRFMPTHVFSKTQYSMLKHLASLQPGELSNYF